MIEVKGTSKVLGIIGNPVSHSISPQIHNFLAKELNIDVVYVPFFVKHENLRTAIDGAFALSIDGLNVTVPFKQDVFNIITDIDSDAQKIGAVNTLKKNHNGYKGFNTDIYGMSKTFKAHNISLLGKTIVILGAGGSAHTAAILAAKENVSKIIIVNRTEKNAILLADCINRYYNNIKVEIFSLSEINLIDCADILIQTTSVGMTSTVTKSPILDDNILSRINVVLDIIYTPWETPLLKSAKHHGLVTINGFEMLVYQAIKSFEIWNNVNVDDEIILKLLNSKQLAGINSWAVY